nr:DUF2239 family protein [Advenella mimigardefordensis]
MREPTYTVFHGYHKLAAGTLSQIASAYQAALKAKSASAVLIFDDETGRSTDIDLRLLDSATQAGLSLDVESTQEEDDQAVRRRGRPKLGVVSREVTLLPRHWEWLAAQPGGASVVLRKLVEAARLGNGDRDARRKAQERAYHFMLALGGDLPGYEEATRALFADDIAALEKQIADWPDDVRVHALQLATPF